jgi:methanol metabolism-related c-type cytochrome
MRRIDIRLIAAAGFGCMVCAAGTTLAQEPAASPPPDGEKKLVKGKWQLLDGTPTFNVVGRGEGEDRIIEKVDWYTYSGWRRYRAECQQCHGPNATGAPYAPALADALKTMTYAKFVQMTAEGHERDPRGTEFIMPALGDNKNVMCYIDDFFIYLKARATGELPPGMLQAHQRDEKPKEAEEHEASCLGQ